MTTLPQTTTVRLPRPSAPAQLMLPTGGGGAAGPGAMPQMSMSDVWRVIRANLWLIIAVLVVSGIGGFALNKFLSIYYPRYTATALVEVEPTAGTDPLKASPNDDRTAVEYEQKTQSQLLKSESLISHVLQVSDRIRATSWFLSFPSVEDAKEDLMDKFSVSAIPSSKLIQLSMSYSIPKDCKVIVEEIVNQHFQDQLKLKHSRQLDATQNLNALKVQLELKLKDIAEELREKVVRLNIDGMGTPGRISTKEIELADMLRRQLDLQATLALAKTAYESTMAQINAGIDPSKVEELLGRDQSLMAYKQIADQADAQLLENSSRLGPDHPLVKQLQRRKEVAQQKLESARAEIKASIRATLVEELRSQAETAQQAYDRVAKQVQTVKQDLGDLSNAMSQYLTRKDEEAAVRDVKKQVDSQLESINRQNTMSDSTGLSWRTLPAIPDTKSFPRLPITMTLAIALGLAVSLGVAFLRELLDTSVRSPRDIVRIGQMNLLGMIPDENDDPQAMGARLPLVIFEAPHSLMAEQFRQVRTRLQHAASLDTTRSILVTSPSPEDGKSTVACNLAAGLALNGRKILLVDANFRRPELHRLFALSNEKGFSDVLNTIDEFASAIRETAVPNLSVITSGSKPQNSTELLESQLLIDFVERALAEYDHVIFDSGPLLFVADTVAMAPRVDGVVTVVRAQANSRGQLQRMRDGLRQVKAEHLGIVLNGVRAQGGGYYARNIKTYYEYQSDNAS